MSETLPVIRPRNGTADLLKGLAVLFMIQVHIMEQFGTTDAYDSSFGMVSLFLGGPFCAPVFIAVMGYFLASSSRPMAYFLKRGAVLFAGGILLNIARSTHLLVMVFSGAASHDPLFYIFGADILTLAGLSLILIGLLRTLFKARVHFYGLVALGVVLVSPYLPRLTSGLPVSPYILAFFWNVAPWSYFPVFPWLGYVLTGYCFRLLIDDSGFHERILKGNRLLPILIPVGIAVLATIPWAVRISHNLTGPGGYYHHGIVFFAWVIAFMVLYVSLIHLVETGKGDTSALRIIKWYGQHVTLVYIIQWIIIGNLAPLLFRSQNIFQLLLWFGGITAASGALAMGYLRIRGYTRTPH